MSAAETLPQREDETQNQIRTRSMWVQSNTRRLVLVVTCCFPVGASDWIGSSERTGSDPDGDAEIQRMVPPCGGSINTLQRYCRAEMEAVHHGSWSVELSRMFVITKVF